MKIKGFIKAFFTTIILMNLVLLYAQTTKVLWIGNSYTSVNNLPQVVRDIALSAGDTVEFDSNAPGGYTFQNHSTNATTIQKIKSQKWNFVVLQAQSQEPSFPPTQVQSQTMPYAHFLDSLVRDNDSCTETIFYMTWGRKYGDQSNCAGYPPLCTFKGMQARLRDSYLQMANDNHAIVAPAGMAWQKSWETDSLINLWSSDNSHPSMAGTYLTACVFYAAIFRKSPIGISYSPLGNQATTTFLQTVAHHTVFDSLSNWNIGTYLPIANFLAATDSSWNSYVFQNNSKNYTSALWNFGDSTQLSTIGNHTYNAAGNYTVKLYVYDDCGNVDSTAKNILITAATEVKPVFNENNISVFPNPTKSKLITVIVNSKSIGSEFKIVNILGATVISGYCLQMHTQLDLSSLKAGFYFLEINNKRLKIELLSE